MKELFRNNEVVISTNGSGEYFVKNIKDTHNQPELRIGINSNGIDLTAYGCQYIPNSFNGVPGFKIR